MSQYYQTTTNSFVDIDDNLFVAWIAANNPKAANLIHVPDIPEYNPNTQTCEFNGFEWVISNKSSDQLNAEILQKRQYLSCSKAQGTQALLQANLLDAVETYIATQSRAIQLDYRDRQEWQRLWPTLVTAAADLGLSEIQVDELFELAVTL